MEGGGWSGHPYPDLSGTGEDAQRPSENPSAKREGGCGAPVAVGYADYRRG